MMRRRGTLLKVAAVTASVVASLSFAGAAHAIDTDGNGQHDFLLREQPYLPYANVGARCSFFNVGQQWYARLTVKPPRVWSLWNLYNQRVAWRATFVDANMNVVAQGAWSYSTASPNQGTDFGGGRDAPGIMITWNEYWQGGQHYDHDANQALKPIVDVAWYNPYSGTWTYRSLRVLWYLTDFNGLVQSDNRITGC